MILGLYHLQESVKLTPSRNKVLDVDELLVDLNLDLNELFKSTFGEPIIDTSLSFEETMERFFEDISRRKQADVVKK